MGNEYVFNSDSDLGQVHLEYLSALLDEHSFANLDAIGIKPGQRCLDLGSGAGTIARGLAERAGPTGRVVAVDVATDHLGAGLAGLPGVEVHRHDINDGLPAPGPYELIHARLLLLHLPNRLEVLDTLVDALAPGGWLMLTEYTGPQQRVVTVPRPEDEEFFYHLQETAHAFPARTVGVSYDWAYEAGPAMAAAGLVNVRAESQSTAAAGGEAPWLLMRNLYRQLWNTFLTNDVLTEAELRRFDDLMGDPRFSAWFYTTVTTCGRRPAG
ncbi:class I SAM-dependent methyltransferase [Flindersiella endophytica]